MITNDKELKVTLARIERLQLQVAAIRKTERDEANYKASVGGFVAEIDRMQLAVREFLLIPPAQLADAV